MRSDGGNRGRPGPGAGRGQVPGSPRRPGGPRPGAPPSAPRAGGARSGAPRPGKPRAGMPPADGPRAGGSRPGRSGPGLRRPGPPGTGGQAGRHAPQPESRPRPRGARERQAPGRPPRRSRPSWARRPLRRTSSVRRLNVTLLSIAFAVSLVLVRLVQLQGVDGSYYRNVSQQERRATAPVPAVRGQIVSSNGTVLAMTMQTDLVYADPPVLKQSTTLASAAGRLAGLLRMPQAAILHLLAASDLGAVRHSRAVGQLLDRGRHQQAGAGAGDLDDADLPSRLSRRRPGRAAARLRRHQPEHRRHDREGRPRADL